MVNENFAETVLTESGESYDDVRQKLYDKYGTNYKIVDSRKTLKPGFLGLFQKEMVVLHYIVLTPSMQAASSGTARKQMMAPPNYGGIDSSRLSNTGGIPGFDPKAFQVSNSPITDFEERKGDLLEKLSPNAGQFTSIMKQINQLQESIENLTTKESDKVEHQNIKKIIELLEENEFTRSYIKKMVARIKEQFSIDELNDFDYVQERIVDWIGESIPIAEKENTIQPPRVIILVGPTGVGKTTTVAKMGAKVAVASKTNSSGFKPVIRMITTDVMRVAAVEQLSNWAEIIKVKVDKVENSDDLKNLCQSYSSNSDYIFVDTAGYSPNDYENIGRMRKTLDVQNLKEDVYLTFSAGVSARDLETITDNYSGFKYKSVIVTKCDETSAFGRLISVLSEKKIPISWITVGQEVMNTIYYANPIWFLEKLSGFKVKSEHIREKFSKYTDNDESI